jgi:hypothetical protein
MPWDSGAYDDGHWDSDSISSPNPKPKKKPIKTPRWFPRTIGNQVICLRNLKTKLPTHATTPLELVPAEVTTFLLDVDNAIYALETYRGSSHNGGRQRWHAHISTGKQKARSRERPGFWKCGQVT